MTLDAAALPEPQLTRFERWLEARSGRHFASYDALWQWSVDELESFWQAVWEYFDLQSPTPHRTVLVERRMPGAQWFPGAQVNYAQQVLRHAEAAHAAGHPAIVWTDEPGLARGELRQLEWPVLRRQVGLLAARLQALGVQRGDRVAALLPNRSETMVAFLACASLGAIWSVCSPDMGPVAVLDRWRQIAPVALIACDGYRHGGQAHDRRALVAQLQGALPGLKLRVDVDILGLPPGGAEGGCPCFDFSALVAEAPLPGEAQAPAPLPPAWLPFDHPLWIVYSSGTTGLPKPIVHGHGGVVLEALKMGRLHNDLGPSVQTGDRFHWYSSTGWIMWNSQLAGLLNGTTVCLFDGSPAAPRNGEAGPPDWSTLWRFAGLAGCTFFGAGAAFYASCLKAGVAPRQVADLHRLRAVGSTGSPLAPECYEWIWQHLPRPGNRPIWISCISGGTDFAGAFLAGTPALPVVAGEMQCRCLGAAVQAFSEPDEAGRGRPLVDEVGELVCTEPMPSMPLYFWGDEPPGPRENAGPLPSSPDPFGGPDAKRQVWGHPDGQRLHDSYFDTYPGVWRHGDWLRIVPHPDAGAAGAIIYGRSDATINRHGIRMGTAELYRAVEAEPEVLDSLVVDLEYLGRPTFMPLFVVLREGRSLDEPLAARLKAGIRQALSPRHVPDVVLQVPAVPRTLSGKKMELPVKKLLLGQPAEKVLNPDAMANAGAVGWFVDYARQRLG